MVPLRFIIGATWVFLSGLSFKAHAQDTPALVLDIESPEGLITLSVGGQVNRDGADQKLTLGGGVQLQRTPDLLIIADEAMVSSTASENANTLASRFDSLTLRGQVYARLNDAELQGDELTISQSNRIIQATGSPLTLQVAGQSIQTDGELQADLDARTFVANGGALAQVDGASIRADQLSLTIPTTDQPDLAPALNASGNVYLQVQEAEIRAGQIRSDEAGTWFFFSGGVQVTSPTSQLSADSAWFNRQTQAFAFNGTPPGAEAN